jgi:hypothetical protein
MATYVFRVWLPDRPGTLGVLATRIGAAGGDLVSIEILERVGGRAIDELTIEMRTEAPIQWLAQELDGVAGVDIEDIRTVGAGAPQMIVDAVDIAAMLVAQRSPRRLITELARWTSTAFSSVWVTVTQVEPPFIREALGPVPNAAAIETLLAETPPLSEAPGAAGALDVVWAPLEGTGLALVVGRPGRPFRVRERKHIAALARIVSLHWQLLDGTPNGGPQTEALPSLTAQNR